MRRQRPRSAFRGFPALRRRGKNERPGPWSGPGLPSDALAVSLDLTNVGGLEPLRALGHLEFDLVALGQALEALSLDGVEVHEHILASLLGDEAVALRIVEPLDGTLCHRHYLSCEACASVKPRHHGREVLLKWRTNKNAAGLWVPAAFEFDTRDCVLAVIDNRVNLTTGFEPTGRPDRCQEPFAPPA